MKLCGLVAAYNEEPMIATVLDQARPYLDDIVVVDDGSDDDTAALAERAGARVIRHPVNEGKGVAVRTGLAHVLKEDFTHVLFIDADLQHNRGRVRMSLCEVGMPSLMERAG